METSKNDLKPTFVDVFLLLSQRCYCFPCNCGSQMLLYVSGVGCWRLSRHGKQLRLMVRSGSLFWELRCFFRSRGIPFGLHLVILVIKDGYGKSAKFSMYVKCRSFSSMMFVINNGNFWVAHVHVSYRQIIATHPPPLLPLQDSFRGNITLKAVEVISDGLEVEVTWDMLGWSETL